MGYWRQWIIHEEAEAEKHFDTLGGPMLVAIDLGGMEGRGGVRLSR